MNAPDEKIVAQLAAIAEIVASGECEAVANGEEPCPLQFDNTEEWCLRCLAKRAWDKYLAADAV